MTKKARRAPYPEAQVQRQTVAEIQVPFGLDPPNDAYIPQHVQSALDREQGMALRRLRHNLDVKTVRLKQNGRVIQTNAEAIRWLLEQLQG